MKSFTSNQPRIVLCDCKQQDNTANCCLITPDLSAKKHAPLFAVVAHADEAVIVFVRVQRLPVHLRASRQLQHKKTEYSLPCEDGRIILSIIFSV